MKPFKHLFMMITVIAGITACSKSNEEEQTPDPPGGGGNGTCVTANMKYSADIVPILQTYCYGCHSNANMAISGISLQGHSNLKARADDGSLVGAITHASGFTPMPQTGPKLSDCNINKIKSWVDSGAPNN